MKANQNNALKTTVAITAQPFLSLRMLICLSLCYNTCLGRQSLDVLSLRNN